jgi:hypothetical protein
MHTKLLFFLMLATYACFSQMTTTSSGKKSTLRSEFVNRAGKKSTLDGVYTTGKLNTLPPCTNLIVNHLTSRGVAPVAKTVTYNLAYSTITGSNKCWLLQNLGSTNPPTSATDNTEAAAGWYWQFASKVGYRYTTTRTPSTTYPNRTLLNVDWSPSEDPCTIELGSGWRLPTYAEWQSVQIAATNLNALYNSELHMHAAGFLTTGGTITERGTTVHYWSSDSYSTSHARAYVIPTLNGTSTTSTNDKDAGFSVRCIRD